MSSNKVIEEKIDTIVEALISLKNEFTVLGERTLEEREPDDIDVEDIVIAPEDEELPIYMPMDVDAFCSAKDFYIDEYMSIKEWKFDASSEDVITSASEKLKSYLRGAKMPDKDSSAGAYIDTWRRNINSAERNKYRHIHIGDVTVSRAIGLDIASNVGGLPAACELFKRLASDISPSDSVKNSAKEEEAIASGLIGEYDFILTEDQILSALGTDYSALNIPGVTDLFKSFFKISTYGYSVASVLAAMYKAAQLIWNTKNEKNMIAAFALALVNTAVEKERDIQHAIDTLYAIHNVSKDSDEFLSFQQLLDAFNMSREDVCKKLNGGNIGIYKVPCPSLSVPCFAVRRSEIEN